MLRTLGGVADLATFAGINRHFTPWSSALWSVAWMICTVLGERPESCFFR